MLKRSWVASVFLAVAAFMGATAAAAATKSPRPPPTLCIGTNCVSTPTGSRLKWNPGHYMASEGILKPGNTLSNFSPEMDDLNGFDHVLGYRLFINWSALEKGEGQYDFSVLDAIFNRLKTHYNKPKRLAIVILPGTFSNTLKSNNDGSSIPTYILQNSKYGPSPVAGSYGWWGINSGGKSTGSYVAALFRPAVQARWNALVSAIAAKYDTDPYFEAFIVQENSWMVGSWKGAPDYNPRSMEPFPTMLTQAVNAFPHTIVAHQNTYLIYQDSTMALGTWMYQNRVATGASDSVGASAFNAGFSLPWGLQAYVGKPFAAAGYTALDQRGQTHAMMDVESVEMVGNYFRKYGGPFTPSDLVDAQNEQYQASHVFWTHFFGNEYNGTVPSAAKWKALATTLESKPLTSTSYPSNFPQ